MKILSLTEGIVFRHYSHGKKWFHFFFENFCFLNSGETIGASKIFIFREMGTSFTKVPFSVHFQQTVCSNFSYSTVPFKRVFKYHLNMENSQHTHTHIYIYIFIAASNGCWYSQSENAMHYFVQSIRTFPFLHCSLSYGTHLLSLSHTHARARAHTHTLSHTQQTHTFIKVR